VKSGFVAVAGRPNVGKSTLVNALCGGKVAIVSDKPQTTRRRIFGIANGDDFQLVLADLPGFQRPLDTLTERMQQTVDSAFEDVEVVLFVLSARGLLPEGPLYFPVEQRTDLPVELQIAELVREKALWLTRDEVPHSISVEVQDMDENVLRANILVETESQKQILVGKGGAMVRDIGTRARPEIEAILGQKVYLELVVKVRPRWRRDAATLERLGL
jgi:GTPase Era involved in 16S rRNA processing